MENLPGYNFISDIENIDDYLKPELILDILDIYWYKISSKFFENKENMNPNISYNENVSDLVDILSAAGNLDELVKYRVNIKEYEQIGRDEIIKLIKKSNPNHPESIIFNSESQKEFKDALEIEIDNATTEANVMEGDITCKCGSRKIEFKGVVQDRSADEGSSARYHCVSCGKNWKSRN